MALFCDAGAFLSWIVLFPGAFGIWMKVRGLAFKKEKLKKSVIILS